MKFCKDCQHYVEPHGFLAGMPGAPFCSAEQCLHPIDMVTGRRRMNSCRVLRAPGQVCGEEAALFAPLAKQPDRRWWRRLFPPDLIGHQPLPGPTGLVPDPPPRKP